MILHWPQITLLILVFLQICIHMGKHGEPRGTYNGGWRLLDAASLMILLYFGGFFTEVRP